MSSRNDEEEPRRMNWAIWLPTIVVCMHVKPFQYLGRTFTVKPTEHVRGFHEVNVDDYVRNLRTALNQTFKPMDIRFSEDEDGKVTLADFI